MAFSTKLHDARQMRALAHPLRLRLLGELRSEGPATATALAQRLGVSVALASYHLRQLGEHGFIEPAPDRSRDAKERWWKAAQERISWSTLDFLDDPERAAAESAMSRTFAHRYSELVDRWLAEQQSYPREWIDASDMSDWTLELSPEETKQMRTELHELVERYAMRQGESDAAGPVRMIVHLFPKRESK